MSTTTTVDADDDVISTSRSTNDASIKITRSISDGNYGSTSCDLFLQLDVDPDEDSDDLETRLKGLASFAKTIVYNQLGIESAQGEDGIVRETSVPVPAPAPKASGGGKPKTSAAGGAKPDKQATWDSFVEDPSAFYDNRPKKANGEFSSKSPDFKHKENGAGIWLDKASEAVKLVASGI